MGLGPSDPDGPTPTIRRSVCLPVRFTTVSLNLRRGEVVGTLYLTRGVERKDSTLHPSSLVSAYGTIPYESLPATPLRPKK